MQSREALTHSDPSSNGARESVAAADWWLVAAALAAVALSAFYIAVNYRAAFPQASLRLELGRDVVTARAQQFLSSRGHRLDSYRSITLFDADDNARLFLEREAGLAEANRLMEREEVPVWQWRARWYRPPQKEEFRVWLSPSGRLTGFDHVLAEDAPGARLDVTAARALAQTFLATRVKWPFTPVEEQSEDRPNRRDHTFTFERGDLYVKGGRIRASVEVRGGQVEAYQEFLKVPEQWQRDFAAMRSKNELYSQIAQAFYVALIIAAAVVLIGGLRRGEIIWKPVVQFAGVVAALNVLAQWNNLPFFLNALPTTTGLGEGFVLALLQSTGSGAGIFLYVLIAAAPGLIAYRDLLPRMLHLPAAFSPRAWQTREWFRAAWAGLGFAAFHLAFVTAFYLIGQRLGVWSPQDVQQSDLLSTFAPWLYPMTTSMLAASSEEFWFRLLAIPLVKRWTGSTWIAILVPAFVWGFLHANYPQQPGYIRGVEVGIIGVSAGWFMLRFGILSTLVWHYTVDAILFSTYLFASDSTGLRVAGLAVSCLALFPLILTWRSYRRHGGFVVEPAWLNAALPHGAAPPVETAAEPDEAIPPLLPSRILYMLAAVLGVAALWFPREVPGQFARVTATRKEALAQAPVPQSAERQALLFAENLDAESFEYLRQQVGAAEANRILRDRTATGVWRIRTFAPGRKNEALDYVGSGGKHFRRDLILDEKAPGANLRKEEALALAGKYLTETQGIRLEQYQLADAATEKREARTDHSFVWEDRTFRAGEARARLSLDILGSEPSEFRRFLKLPEQWQRDYRKPRLAALLLPAAAGGFVFFILGIFMRSVRRAPFRPRKYAIAGIAATAILLAMEANEWPQFYAGYSTEQPLADFHGDFVLSLAMRTLLAGGAVFLMAYMLDVLLHILQGDRRTQPLSLPQAVAVVIAGAGALRIVGAVEQWIPGVRYSHAMWSAPPVDAWSPALAVLLNAGLAALIGALMVPLAVIAGIAMFSPTVRPYYAMAVAIGWGLLRGGASPALVGYQTVAMLALLLLASVLTRVLSTGIATLGAAIFLAIAGSGAYSLWQQPPAALQLEAAAVGVTAVSLLGAAFAFTRTAK